VYAQAIAFQGVVHLFDAQLHAGNGGLQIVRDGGKHQHVHPRQILEVVKF